GGYALVIDEDAYEVAERYLNTLTRHFAKSESSAEIMEDIETRMGELVSKNKGTRTIVSKIDVLDAISVLGTPEEMGNIDFSEGVYQQQKREDRKPFQLKTGKRLFRDPDDKIIGGVCSGLAAYFGIKDPIWVRLAFALLVTVAGTGVLAYFLIMILTPEAKTVSDRLEMMGEPTNVNNIAKMVRDGVEDIGDKLQDTFSRKKKADFGSPADKDFV